MLPLWREAGDSGVRERAPSCTNDYTGGLSVEVADYNLPKLCEPLRHGYHLPRKPLKFYLRPPLVLNSLKFIEGLKIWYGAT